MSDVAAEMIAELPHTMADLDALVCEEPLKTLRIGDVDYPIGQLNAHQIADLKAWTERHSAFRKGRGTLLKYDMDPARALLYLLYAGIPDGGEVALDRARPHIRPAHIVASLREYLRQAMVAELDPSKMAGRA